VKAITANLAGSSTAGNRAADRCGRGKGAVQRGIRRWMLLGLRKNPRLGLACRGGRGTYQLPGCAAADPPTRFYNAVLDRDDADSTRRNVLVN
jgi:hypothetical protein